MYKERWREVVTGTNFIKKYVCITTIVTHIMTTHTVSKPTEQIRAISTPVVLGPYRYSNMTNLESLQVYLHILADNAASSATLKELTF